VKGGNRKLNHNAGVSRQGIRFEKYRMAQQALFDAESRLNARLDEGLNATREFNAMQLELERLLGSKATVVSIVPTYLADESLS